MERWTILLFLLASAFLLIEGVTAAPLNCYMQSSCTGAQTELLSLEGENHGTNNSHVQLVNYTGTAYNWSICCATDGTHRLNNSCKDENATVILRAYGTSNSHVEIPSVNNYTYDICMAGSPGNITCSYINGTCTGTLLPILSMASSEANDGYYNRTNAHISNASVYTYTVCCEISNAPPTVPVLIYPTNGNESVFERNVALNWTASTDPDGDPVTYQLSLNVSTASGSCSVEHQETGIGDTNFTTDELCVDQYYNWTVRACDPSQCSDWAPVWNFTVASVLGIKFRANTTNFGSLANDVSANTEDGPATPLSVENDGNIVEDVDFRALAKLFTNSTLGMHYFQYHVSANESGSFNLTNSQTSWENVSDTFQNAFDNLSYIDQGDDGLIHLNVTVPTYEPAGGRSTTVVVRAIAS